MQADVLALAAEIASMTAIEKETARAAFLEAIDRLFG